MQRIGTVSGNSNIIAMKKADDGVPLRFAVLSDEHNTALYLQVDDDGSVWFGYQDSPTTTWVVQLGKIAVLNSDGDSIFMSEVDVSSTVSHEPKHHPPTLRLIRD